MANTSLLLVWLSSAFLVPAAFSLTCTSQHFNRSYTGCTDLPHLNSYFHWAYNAPNNSLSVAFVATPPHEDGWVAWATNPYGIGMVGSHALMAFKGGDGALTLKTYNISSYLWLEESKLDIDVWDLAAERRSDGSTAILAKLKLSKEMDIRRINLVWQVGSSVVGGVPVRRHENDDAMKTMDLSGAGEFSVAARIRSEAGEYSVGKKKIKIDGSVLLYMIISLSVFLLFLSFN